MLSLIFCTCSPPSYQFVVNEPIDTLPIDVKHNAVADAAETLIWLATRQCEMLLFRYLQEVANSSEPVGGEEIRGRALNFFHALTLVPNNARKAVEQCRNAHTHVPFIDIALIDQLQDRQDRIRAALFVYTSISISKLPAWSEFWSQMKKEHFSFSRETILASLASIEASDGLLESRIEQMKTSGVRFIKFQMALEEMDANHDSNASSDSDAHSDSDSLERFFKLFRAMCDGKTDEIIEMTDKELTGRLLSAKTPEEVARRRLRAFFDLATFDWEKGLPRSSKENASMEGLRRLKLLATIQTRSEALFVHNAMKEMMKRLVTSGCSESMAHNVIKERRQEIISLLVDGNHMKLREMNLKCDRKMREGARWAELVDLMGADEILLYGRITDPLTSGTALQTIALSTIVNQGTDQEFRHLKKLLQSPTHLWVKETCLELRGVLKMIEKAAEVRISHWAESLALAQQIKARVIKVFGSRSFAIELCTEKTGPLEEYLQLFVLTILKHYHAGDRHLLVVFIEGGMEAFRITRRERNDAVDRDNGRARIKCLRKNLRVMAEGFREAVKEPGAATPQQVDRIRRSLLEAIESFILAISAVPKGCLQDAVDGSDEEGAEFRKYLGRSCEAFKATFSLGQ